MTVKFTSGGTDKGARPICDGRDVDAEKDREETTGKAGSRYDGRDMHVVEAITLSSPLDLTVEIIAERRSMVVGLFLFLELHIFGNLAQFLGCT
jgi:hypothetical protein